MSSSLIANEIISIDLSKDEVFENVFKQNFYRLKKYAQILVKDPLLAEEMVQNVFIKIWEKRSEITIYKQLDSYLFRSIRNECYNYFAHEKVKAEHLAHSMYQQKQNGDISDGDAKVNLNQLRSAINCGIETLPQQCKNIFELSRYGELKNREIADVLGISIKTVENQMGKALKILRLHLIDFLPILTLFLSYLK